MNWSVKWIISILQVKLRSTTLAQILIFFSQCLVDMLHIAYYLIEKFKELGIA